MGRNWYLDGKLMHKKNTFTDFIACADYLVNESTVPATGWPSRAAAPAGC